MAKRILVDATYPQETRVVLLNDNNQIEELEYETSSKQQIKGNIYLAKIVRIEPSLQAAFIEYGNDKNGFLPFSEIHPVYYHIPASDRDKISADLQSIDRPNITQKDMADADKKQEANADADLLSLDGESDEIEQEEQVADSDEEIEKPKSFKENLYNQYKIQDVIKKGQIILVQAEKESRGNKGASFTSYISLAGKYCVLMPNSGGHNGISRKIANGEERRRLRSIIDELILQDDADKASLIIRTAGVRKTTYDIKRDYDYLVRLWNKIREVTLQSTAPAFIHMEDDIIKKTIRDMCDHNVKEVLVQGEYARACAAEVMHNMLPSDANKIVGYTAKTPLFSKFGVEEQLSSLYQPISALSSGGYIVINPTEALISIDVNSGRATSERSIEETAVRTNIEAAKEIARQLKLRDLSGLIVVDFIDMYESRNRKLVEKTLKEALSRDRAKIQIGHISTFGLLEMSRQRLRSSFLESNTKMCNHCNGKGIVRADESNAMLILRTIEQEIFTSEVSVVNVYAHLAPVLHLLNNKRHEIQLIEEKYGITLNFHHDLAATSDSFSIEKIRNTDKSDRNKQEGPKPALSLSANLFDGSSEPLQDNKSSGQKSRRAKKWKEKSHTSEPTVVAEPVAVEVVKQPEQESEKTLDKAPKKRRNNRYKDRKDDKQVRDVAVQTEKPVEQAEEKPANQISAPKHNKPRHAHKPKAKPEVKVAESAAPEVHKEEVSDKAPTRRRKTVRKPSAEKKEA